MDIKKIEEDHILKKLSIISQETRTPIYIVGGYIRNLLLDKTDKLNDYDLAIPHQASSIIPLIEESLGIHFFKIGDKDTINYRYIKEEFSIDLTFLQGDSIKEDLQRRDFTINALAYSLLEKKLYWIEGTFEDIEKKVIRATTKSSIENDPLRMLRAIRYLCTLKGFSLDQNLYIEILNKKDLIENVAKERIKMEMDYILLSPKPDLGLETLYKTGLLFKIIPEFNGLENIGEDDRKSIDVISHSILTLKYIPWSLKWFENRGRNIILSSQDRLSLFWASLMHDIGKKDTYSKDENGKIHFYHHEKLSAEIAKKIMERLRFSNHLKEKVLELVRNHMRILNLTGSVKDNTIKKLINKMGQDITLLLLLTMADREAWRTTLNKEINDDVEITCLRILELSDQSEIIDPPKLITGHDILALGYTSGPIIGEILNLIREKQLDGEIKTRKEALDFIKNRFNPEK